MRGNGGVGPYIQFLGPPVSVPYPDRSEDGVLTISLC